MLTAAVCPFESLAFVPVLILGRMLPNLHFFSICPDSSVVLLLADCVLYCDLFYDIEAKTCHAKVSQEHN